MAHQKYNIISKIDAGGMAEVWKGVASSMRGFDKPVAIKRVLPHLAQNQEFIRMFLDEARLSLFLNHANIVQTFDIGRSNDAFFIVMEWIDGVNLKKILETANAEGFRIAPEQAIFICAEVCKGLGHAHQRRDTDGNPLNIVHRDVSPPNVLMSREGEVKLVDFGLAKAASQVAQTDPGVVKGKFSYLSPESAYGHPVDGRSDIFSVGLVLWETLAGRRCFEGVSDMDTVKLVRATRVPSLRQFNDQVDEELEALVNQSLAREPSDRFQTAEAFGHELTRYLFRHRLMVTSYDIAMLVQRVQSIRETTLVESHPQTSGANALEAAVRAQMAAFAPLEELEKMEFQSIAESEGSLDMPKPGAEDPRGWASEMGVVDGDETIMDVPAHIQDELAATLTAIQTEPPISPTPAAGIVRKSRRIVPKETAPAPVLPAPSLPPREAAPAGHAPPARQQPRKQPAATPRPDVRSRGDSADFPNLPPTEPLEEVTNTAKLIGIAAGVGGAVVLGIVCWVLFT